jgi:hypothetical protein
MAALLSCSRDGGNAWAIRSESGATAGVNETGTACAAPTLMMLHRPQLGTDPQGRCRDSEKGAVIRSAFFLFRVVVFSVIAA